ncbi:MAG: hypothetical protein QOH69_264 [Actinomycetota bacterium]|jgi:prepilin-type N-terminal cleavage/methylation domain-containing protein|nr:hypothetical protein [Actinomycetota bacterium]
MRPGFPLSRIGRARRGADTGFTLIELMIAMLVFSIFLAIVVTSIVGLTRSASRIQVAAVSSNQELAVFASLDRQIRYADGINTQGTGAVNTYIEFRTPADSTPTHTTVCTQWRYDPTARTIANRTWTDGNLGSASPWHVMLNNVANDGGTTYPFAFVGTSTSSSKLEEMTLTLDAGSSLVKGAKLSSTFVARNSADTTGAVCPAAGSRP